MQKYSEFRPTGFDSRGLALPDRQDWFVVPVGRNRDSEVRSRANFQAALDILGGEQDDLVEVHRFGHWGGWFEILIVSPLMEEKAQEIEDSLASYPILDESLLSEMEEEERWNDWKSWAGREFVKQLVLTFGLMSPTEDWLFDRSDELYAFHLEHSPDYENSFNYLSRTRPARNDLAKFIRELRKRERENPNDQ